MAGKELKVSFAGSKKALEIPITDGTIPATAFAAIKTPDGEGLRVYDNGYQNTAVVRSAICYIDGDNGILEYRGYPIEELAEKSSFLEVSYLLIYGNLPSKARSGLCDKFLGSTG